MTYVDGFLIPLPKDKQDAYLEMAECAKEVWMSHGAVAYVECIAEDVKKGETTDFFSAVKCEENETVIFSYVVYKSREHRDEVLKKSMEDPRMQAFSPETMPFDGKRMIWGGFKTIVEA